jgi:hypothetical protein
MDYNEYIETIRNEMQTKMGDDFSITISRVKKNNGIVLQGICITDQTNRLSPVFYLNDQFQADRNAGTKVRVHETVGDIIRLYYDQCLSAHIDLGLFKSYEKMKDKVLYRLINFEKNKELLEEIPHKRFYDLAMVFYCDIQNDFFENGSILLYNSHLESWGITLAEVFAAAFENTPRCLPAILQTMTEVMKELLEVRIFEKYGDDAGTKVLVNEFFFFVYSKINEDNMMQDGKRYKMYVAGNVPKLYGAAVLLYPDFIKNLASQLQADLYVFPSSVHEIIIVPAEKSHDRAELLKMVCEINATQVSPEEVLADTIYFYRRSLDVLEMIS